MRLGTDGDNRSDESFHAMMRRAAAEEDPQLRQVRMAGARAALPPELRDELFLTFYKSWPAFDRSVPRE